MQAQEGKLGVRGLAPGKNSHNDTLKIVGKRPIWENLPFKEAKKHHESWGPSGKFKKITAISHVGTLFLNCTI